MKVVDADEKVLRVRDCSVQGLKIITTTRHIDYDVLQYDYLASRISLRRQIETAGLAFKLFQHRKIYYNFGAGSDDLLNPTRPHGTCSSFLLDCRPVAHLHSPALHGLYPPRVVSG